MDKIISDKNIFITKISDFQPTELLYEKCPFFMLYLK